jgi:hypothetical protein
MEGEDWAKADTATANRGRAMNFMVGNSSMKLKDAFYPLATHL